MVSLTFLFPSVLMLRSILLTGLRSAQRQPGTALVNVVGLAVGVAACLLLGLHIYHELAVDHFHDDADRIYRVVKDTETDGETIQQAITAAPAGPAIEETFPAVEESVRFFSGSASLMKGDTQLALRSAHFTDPALFDLFDFPLRYGDPDTALDGPDKVVLSAETAARYFGDTNPVGETLQEATLGTVTVSGVLEPIPPTSTIDGEVFFSLKTLDPIYPEQLKSWFANGLTTYLLLEEGADPEALEAQFPAFLEAQIADEMAELGIRNSLFLEPMLDSYLSSERVNQMWETGNAAHLWMFGGVTLLILLIACANFANIATAQATDRTMEAGVRKSLGATPGQLARLFLGETALTVAISVALGGFAAVSTLPAFNQLAGTEISLAIVPTWVVVAAPILLTAIATVLAGAYPTLVLSRLSSDVLRSGRGTVGRGGSSRFRQSLIVLQFAVAVMLIASTAIMFTQIDHLQQYHLGFEDDHMLVVEGSVEGLDRVETVRQEMAAIPGVKAVTATAGVPSIGEGRWLTTIDRGESALTSNIALYTVDDAFLDVYGIDLVAGRGFRPGSAADSASALILNETAVEHFEFASPEAALGATFDQLGRRGTVVGVVEDYHYQSLHDPIGPLSLRPLQSGVSTISLKLAAGNLPSVMDEVRSAWDRLVPEQAFNAQFLDDRFDLLYRQDRRFGQIFGTAAGLALFLACLGLLGLIAITARQRRREIGIRKALGASAARIVRMLSGEVVVLVGVATAIGAPVAYVGVQRWLDTFAVQVDVSVAWFLGAGLVVLLLSTAAASVHAVQAARVNPAQTLKQE